MTAYNKKNLYNKYAQEQSSFAFRSQCIDESTYKKILETHVDNLYTPNFFIRIGLALLTLVAIASLFLLIALFTHVSGEDGFIGLCVFFAIMCYGSLELMVHVKNYYNAGIDNLLMALIVLFFIISLSISEFPNQYEVISFTIMIVSLFLAIRFTDAFMSILAYVNCIGVIFLIYTKFGTFTKATAPFVIMIVSLLFYFLMKKIYDNKKMLFYKFSIHSVMILTLISLYAAGNYFVVRELSEQMFGLELKPGGDIAFGWLFWLFTATTPVAYIFYGIRKKDLMLLRTGVILIVTSAATVKYYYEILPIEDVMIICGMLAITISYALVRYLSTPKYGFTFENTDGANKILVNAETIIITQVFGNKSKPVKDHLQFGGGTSEGGGASGDF